MNLPNACNQLSGPQKHPKQPPQATTARSHNPAGYHQMRQPSPRLAVIFVTHGILCPLLRRTLLPRDIVNKGFRYEVAICFKMAWLNEIVAWISGRPRLYMRTSIAAAITRCVAHRRAIYGLQILEPGVEALQSHFSISLEVWAENAQDDPAVA